MNCGNNNGKELQIINLKYIQKKWKRTKYNQAEHNKQLQLGWKKIKQNISTSIYQPKQNLDTAM